MCSHALHRICIVYIHFYLYTQWWMIDFKFYFVAIRHCFSPFNRIHSRKLYINPVPFAFQLMELLICFNILRFSLKWSSLVLRSQCTEHRRPKLMGTNQIDLPKLFILKWQHVHCSHGSVSKESSNKFEWHCALHSCSHLELNWVFHVKNEFGTFL